MIRAMEHDSKSRGITMIQTTLAPITNEGSQSLNSTGESEFAHPLLHPEYCCGESLHKKMTEMLYVFRCKKCNRVIAISR